MCKIKLYVREIVILLLGADPATDFWHDDDGRTLAYVLRMWQGLHQRLKSPPLFELRLALLDCHGLV